MNPPLSEREWVQWHSFFEVLGYTGTALLLGRMGFQLSDPLSLRDIALECVRRLSPIRRADEARAPIEEALESIRRRRGDTAVEEIRRFVREDFAPDPDCYAYLWVRLLRRLAFSPTSVPLPLSEERSRQVITAIKPALDDSQTEAWLEAADPPQDDDDRAILSTYDPGITPSVHASRTLASKADQEALSIFRREMADVADEAVLSWAQRQAEFAGIRPIPAKLPWSDTRR